MISPNSLQISKNWWIQFPYHLRLITKIRFFAAFGAGGVIYLTSLIFNNLGLSATDIGLGFTISAIIGTVTRLFTGNYLNNVLARIEAQKMGAEDAIMVNSLGQLTEGTTSNLSFVKGGRLLTPVKECGILSGITREKIIQIAHKNGITLEEGKWSSEELFQAEEIFLSGTVKKVLPVTILDNRPVGEGMPGPITQKIMKLYSELLESLD